MTEKEGVRVAAITGVTSGIGEATARRLIKADYNVIGNARSIDKLAELENELGKRFVAVAGDASEAATIDAVLAAGPNHFKQSVDTVIVNAGCGLGGAVTEVDISKFAAIQKLNVTGAFLLMQQAAKQMVAAQADRFPRAAADIVVIGSVVGRHVSPFSAAYGATKFALHSLTEALRREIGPKGVRVTLVEPGFVRSGFQEAAGYSEEMIDDFAERVGPFLTGDDIADAISYALSLPAHIHLGDMVIRPTRQEYP